MSESDDDYGDDYEDDGFEPTESQYDLLAAADNDGGGDNAQGTDDARLGAAHEDESAAAVMSQFDLLSDGPAARGNQANGKADTQLAAAEAADEGDYGDDDFGDDDDYGDDADFALNIATGASETQPDAPPASPPGQSIESPTVQSTSSPRAPPSTSSPRAPQSPTSPTAQSETSPTAQSAASDDAPNATSPTGEGDVVVTDLSNTQPVDTVVPEEHGGAEADADAAPPQAWEEDRGVIIDEPESEETRQRRYEQEVLRSTQRGWGKQLEAHPHPDLFSQFTVTRQVRHILDNSIHPATSHAAPPRARSRRSRRSRRGKRTATMKRTGGSASVPALPLARSSRKRHAKKGGVKPKFSPVSGTRPSSAHDGDVAQTSARTRHFYDMAALKAVIDREGQIRRVKHDVKLVRDALRADPSTNVDTLVKQLLDSLMLLRTTTVATVEAVTEWRQFVGARQDGGRGRKMSSASRPEVDTASLPSTVDDTLPPFVWEGRNYLRKMRTDTDFLADVPTLLEVLSLPPDRLRNNPLMAPKTLAELADEERDRRMRAELDAMEVEDGSPVVGQQQETAAASGEEPQPSSKQAPSEAAKRREAAQRVLVLEEVAAREEAETSLSMSLGVEAGGSRRSRRRLEDTVQHPLFTSSVDSRRSRRGRRSAPKLESSLAKSINSILLRQNRRTSLQSPPTRPMPGVLGMPDGRLVHDPDSDITQVRGGAKLVPLPVNIVSHTYFTHGYHPTGSTTSFQDSLYESSSWTLPMVTPEALRPTSPEQRAIFHAEQAAKRRRRSPGRKTQRRRKPRRSRKSSGPRTKREVDKVRSASGQWGNHTADQGYDGNQPDAMPELDGRPVDAAWLASDDDEADAAQVQTAQVSQQSSNAQPQRKPKKARRKKKRRKKKRSKSRGRSPHKPMAYQKEQEALREFMQMEEERQRAAQQAQAAADEEAAAAAAEAAMDADRFEPITEEDRNYVLMAVLGCTMDDARQFGELRSVPAGVGLVAAVAMLCMKQGNHIPHDLSWAGVRYTFLRAERLAESLDGYDPDAVALFKFRACAPLMLQSLHNINVEAFEEGGAAACSTLQFIVRLVTQNPRRVEAWTQAVIDHCVEVLRGLPGGFPQELLETPIKKVHIERRRMPTQREQAAREEARRQRAATRIQSQARRRRDAARVDVVRQRKRAEEEARQRQAAAVRIQAQHRRRRDAARVDDIRRRKREAEELAARQREAAATKVQSVARSRLARNRVRSRAEFARTDSGRALRVRRHVKLYQAVRCFNDGRRLMVRVVRVAADTGYEVRCSTTDMSEELKLALPWSMFGIPRNKREAEKRAMADAATRLAIMVEDGNGRLHVVPKGFKPSPSVRRAVVLSLKPTFRTSRRIGGDLLNVSIVRVYGGRYGASGYVVNAVNVITGETLRTVVPEEEVGLSVLAPTAGHDFHDAMVTLCNTLVVSEADGTVLLHEGQPEALQRHKQRVLAEREARAAEEALDADAGADAAPATSASHESESKQTAVAAPPVAELSHTVSFAPKVEVVKDEGGAAAAGSAASESKAALEPVAVASPQGDHETFPVTPHPLVENMLSPTQPAASGRNLHSLLARDQSVQMQMHSPDTPAPSLSFRLPSRGSSMSDADALSARESKGAPAQRSRSSRSIRPGSTSSTRSRRSTRSSSPSSRRNRIVPSSSARPPKPDRLSDKGRTIAMKRRQEYAAALKIQSQGRRRLAAKRVQSMRRRRSNAASRIQAMHRGKAARSRVQRIRAGEEDAFADDKFIGSRDAEHARLGVGSNAADPYARASNAGRAHAHARRQAYDEERRAAAATRIQSVARGKRDRERVDKIRQERRRDADAQSSGGSSASGGRVVNRRHRAGLGSITSAGYSGRDPQLSPVSGHRSSYAGSVHSLSSSSRRFRGDHPDFGPSSDEEEEFSRNTVAERVYAPYSSTSSVPN